MSEPTPSRRAPVRPAKPAKKASAAPLTPVSMLGRAALTTLTNSQRESVVDWLQHQNLPLNVVCARILDEFNLLTNTEALAHWWLGQQFAQDIRASSALATELQTELAALPVAFDPRLLTRTSQAKFEAEVARHYDLKDHVALRRLQQTDRSQALAERSFEHRRSHQDQQIQLARDKFEFDAAELVLEHAEALRTIAADRSLPREDKLNAVRLHLFGPAPQPPAADRAA